MSFFAEPVVGDDLTVGVSSGSGRCPCRPWCETGDEEDAQACTSLICTSTYFLFVYFRDWAVGTLPDLDYRWP